MFSNTPTCCHGDSLHDNGLSDAKLQTFVGWPELKQNKGEGRERFERKRMECAQLGSTESGPHCGRNIGRWNFSIHKYRI